MATSNLRRPAKSRKKPGKKRPVKKRRQTSLRSKDVTKTKKGGRLCKAKPAPKKQPRLERQTFQTSREMDFFSTKELVSQTGHSIYEWPEVVVKVLVDNALDACEEANIAPVISIKADPTGIKVTDNEPGLPESTLRGAVDFKVRCSSREMYVSPCRGAQGNALMTLIAMPFVLDPEHVRFIVVTGGTRHEIVCRCDPISQRPVVDDNPSPANGAPGTSVRIQWKKRKNDYGDWAWPFARYSCDGRYDELTEMAYGFAFFNPHHSLTFDWFGEKLRFKSTDPQWRKWTPSKPTSPHWYDPSRFERLIAANITLGRDNESDRTVYDYLREFDG